MNNNATRSSVEASDADALQLIAAGTAGTVGEDFFKALVRSLAMAANVNHALVSEFIPPSTIKTLAYYSHGEIVANIEYQLPGTPCELVVRGELCHIPAGVEQRYPREEGIESYLGLPLAAKGGQVLGHLAIFDETPMPEEPRRLPIIRIFAARAAAELARMHAEQRLHESEERFRDLFDEAPIAYVHEDLQSRFLRANRAALRILGVRPDEVDGMVGISLVPDTPDAQRRVKEAFASVGRGTDTSGVVLELRRKDNGKPVWLQWWSKPDPGGTYTRTMFLDITERVQMEQERSQLQAQNSYLQEEIKAVHNFEEIIGASQGLIKVLRHVGKVAPTEATVLILGESGTGKELIARATHSASKRADKPFIKLNCAALPQGLVESELFGHERGAFSGALQKRLGRFELADGGTIFLDEIGEMPLDVQVKLLRVLQEREFERVGGGQTIHVDVRVVAATNRNLQKAIEEGKFREDLYYRLNVFPVSLPPLRERSEDIPLLVKFFIAKYAPRVGRRTMEVELDTLERLMRYHWPGNIRELENLVERALILSTEETLRIEPEVLPMGQAPSASAIVVNTAPSAGSAASAASADSSALALNEVQREHILITLHRTHWVIEGERGAAQQLGMKPATLRHRMKKLGISRSG